MNVEIGVPKRARRGRYTVHRWPPSYADAFPRSQHRFPTPPCWRPPLRVRPQLYLLLGPASWGPQIAKPCGGSVGAGGAKKVPAHARRWAWVRARPICQSDTLPTALAHVQRTLSGRLPRRTVTIVTGRSCEMRLGERDLPSNSGAGGAGGDSDEGKPASMRYVARILPVRCVFLASVPTPPLASRASATCAASPFLSAVPCVPSRSQSFPLGAQYRHSLRPIARDQRILAHRVAARVNASTPASGPFESSAPAHLLVCRADVLDLAPSAPLRPPPAARAVHCPRRDGTLVGVRAPIKGGRRANYTRQARLPCRRCMVRAPGALDIPMPSFLASFNAAYMPTRCRRFRNSRAASASGGYCGVGLLASARPCTVSIASRLSFVPCRLRASVTTKSCAHGVCVVPR
ncbi:hypothetical protein B0H15DRAFT_1004494 [Mycena belliarum]|uniref:Uncharacterized protein n=1 Tax=Mycena belliarum TaxID=1033014 RepID=A0AAD6TRA1_9AGAR|nr:hypothetical protein B0H15DRAFT_1004494 [Mycena belliae]